MWFIVLLLPLHCRASTTYKWAEHNSGVIARVACVRSEHRLRLRLRLSVRSEHLQPLSVIAVGAIFAIASLCIRWKDGQAKERMLRLSRYRRASG
jgi:hypothetical protein